MGASHDPSHQSPLISGTPKGLVNLFYFKNYLTVLGIHCCVRAFSSCSEQGLSLFAVLGLPI